MDIFEAVKSESPHIQEIIKFYKINPCFTIQPQKTQKTKALGNICDHRTCFYYHNYQEKRRPAFDEKTHQLLYEPNWCRYLYDNIQCPNGDLCPKSHSQNEIDYHPLYYKTVPCEGCQPEIAFKFCPYFHQDEVDRTLVLEKFRMKKSRENSTIQGFGEPTMKTGFNLDSFKVKPCGIKGNHNPKVCNYYHFNKDQRRPTNVYSYTPTLCSYTSKNRECPKGDDCEFCHNKVEQLYHPDRYKRKFCLCHPHNIHKCEYGDYCSFAHSEAEIKIELLHNMKKDQQFYLYKYKTVYCPYIYDHDRHQCVYAHNPQDFRRDPSRYSYNSTQCQYWAQGQLLSYEDGKCPYQMNCPNCHGWKEFYYHPMNYKTKECPKMKNCTKVDCPFLHPEKEGKEKTVNQTRNMSMGTMREFEGIGHQKQMFEAGQMTSQFNPQYNMKHERKNQSHFTGPIMPQMAYPYIAKDEVYIENKGKQRYYNNEGSTRPNSNVSSMFCQEEDNSKNNFWKKKKQMSLQNKQEYSKDSSSDINKGKNPKRVSSPQMDFWDMQKFGSEERIGEAFEERKDSRKASGTKANESFDSLQSYTIERNVAGAERSSASKLSEARKAADEETGGSTALATDLQINALPDAHGDENQWTGNLDFLDNNNNLDFTRHPF